jgi:hypothetical protein
MEERGKNADYDLCEVKSPMLLAGEINCRWGMLVYGCC